MVTCVHVVQHHKKGTNYVVKNVDTLASEQQYFDYGKIQRVKPLPQNWAEQGIRHCQITLLGPYSLHHQHCSNTRCKVVQGTKAAETEPLTSRSCV